MRKPGAVYALLHGTDAVKAAVRAERASTLDEEAQLYVKQGYTIETMTDHVLVVTRAKKCNHILHLLLSVVTMGVWIPVWVVLGANAAMGSDRKVITR